MPKYEINLDHLAEVEACVSAPIPVGPSSCGTVLGPYSVTVKIGEGVPLQ